MRDFSPSCGYRKSKQLILFLVLPVFFGLVLTGCAGEIKTEEQAKPVKTMKVEEKEKLVSLEYFGIIASRETKKYSFKVAGKINEVFVEKGQKIAKGEPLAELDKTDLQFSFKAAQFTMVKAESAYLDAKDFYEKVKILQENGASSQRDLDLARLDMEVKEAGFNQAKVDYDYKLSMLNDASIYADMDGYVVDNLSEKGEVTAAGYPVIVVRSAAQVVNVGLTRKDIAKVKKGTKAQILADGSAKELAGEITLLDQIPDPESRTYNARISFADAEESNTFSLGSTCRVLLEAGTAKGLWIPLTAIQNDGQDFVYVIKDKRALRKNISIRNTTATLVQVDGLESGEEIVIAGMKNLADGSLIEEGAETV